MKINIKSFENLKFTFQEENFIQALEDDKFFEDFVAKTRSLFPKSKNKSSKFKTNRMQWIFIAAHILVKAYKNLPDYWIVTFGYIIAEDVAMPSVSKNWSSIRYEYIEKSEDAGFGPPKKIIQISIESKTSIKQISEFLNKAKGLKEALERLPEQSNVDTDIKNYTKILQLSKQYKGKELMKEVNKFWKVNDYNTLDKYKKRGKEYINRLLKTDQKYLKNALINLYSLGELAKRVNYSLPQDI